jgi:endonuclease-3
VTAGRAGEILDRLQPHYAGLTTGLTFSSPLELVVATILSAQCTDERVNTVTPELFARYKSAQDYATADVSELEEIIHSCGFYRNKAKNIRGMAQRLVETYGGQVPDRMEDLITLPGVARKTANVVLSHAFGRDEGIAVDTHVTRLSQRLGLTTSKDPVKIEQDLMRLTPRARWGRVSDLLIWHGRNVCLARKPRCEDCVLFDLCPSAVVPVAINGGSEE